MLARRAHIATVKYNMPSMRLSARSTVAPRACTSFRRAKRMRCRAETESKSEPASQPKMITRKDPIASEWLGPNDQTPIPEEDFWEGERWELVGKSLKFALPALALLAVGIGFFASRIYNEGADSYLVQGAEDRPAQIVSAEELGF